MKKLLFLIAIINLYAITPVCNVFSDVLQTRHNPSHITMSGDGNIYSSPSCNLNTGSIYQGKWYPKLYCNSSSTSATGNYGESMTINYSFSIDSTSISSSPTSSTTNKTVSSSQTLTNTEYNKITINNWGSSIVSVFLDNIGTKKINEISLTKNTNIDFTNSSGDLEIGDLGSKGGWNENNYIYNSTTLHDIKINNIYLKSNGDISFEANNSVQIHYLEVGRNGSTIILKAPTITIDTLKQTSSSYGSSSVEIYANNININTIDLGQDATLKIHPFDSDHNVTFHSDSISASSSSSMIVDSGDYYTNTFSIPGTSGVSSIKASDNSQIINFFINGDFSPGNNPGINSAGNNGNFGSLTPANFRLFINGDLNTGGGGTTFNCLVYVEGDAKLGSPTYVKGAISANTDIKIYNNSKFYYDTSIETSELGGLCVAGYSFDNRYSCNIFSSVLTAYDTLRIASNNIFGTCRVSADNYIESGSSTCNGCSCVSGTCNSDTTCQIVDIPKNKYTHTVLETTDTTSQTTNSNLSFSNKEYGNYIFNKNHQIITLSPTNSYDDNPTKLMLFGDVEFSKNHQMLYLDEGDYYFKSFVSNGSHFSICTTGNVRIFVKNNFELNGNNIDTSCGTGHLFVYSEGNSIIGHNGGGQNDVHLYLYSKGDVVVRNNANASDIYGAITAEGDINITGNNVNFHYDSDYLDNFGVGECNLCYDEQYVSRNGFSMFMFSMCTPFTPCEWDIPIRNTSNNTLDNVIVRETYNNSTSITMSFFNMSKFDTIDKDGNHIGNGASKNSSSDYSIYNLADFTLNPTSIVYDFGDNYPTYQPDENYYRAYKKSTMSFSISMSPSNLFNKWKNNIVYLAQYEDNGKNYSIRMDACPYTNISNQTSGFVDSWDNYISSRGINDRNISTKIVNKPFDLTIAYISSGYAVNTTGASVKYYLKDMNTTNQISTKNTLTIPSNIYTTTTQSYNIGSAYKNVKVEFKVCANYNISTGYTLYPYGNCSSDCSSNEEENNICYRYFQSTDAFAIRPDKFDISGIGVNRADNNITFLDIKALDYNSNEANNTDISNDSINIEASDDLCVAMYPDYEINFEDGIGKINYLKYQDVGEIKLTISEKTNKEFAIIDSDDTDDNDRYITSAESNRFAVIPDHFDIDNISVNNHNNNTFTYLSNDLNMSGELNATITAKNASGTTTVNYKTGCYSKDTNFNIAHSSDTSMDNLNKIVTQYGENLKDDNISFSLDESNFSDGSMNLNLKINFDRNQSLIVNPFTLTLNEIFVTDSNNSQGNSSIGLDLYFLYGRMEANDFVTIDSTANLVNLFKYYGGMEWIKNTAHNNKNDGYISNLVTVSNIDFNLNENSIANGEQNISISPKTDTRPYKVKSHLNIPSYLWYSDKSYEAPSSNNMDCTTHPCINILFLKQGTKAWGGVGTDEKENNITNNSIQIEIKQNKIKNNKFRKLNW